MRWKILLIAALTVAFTVSCKKNSEDTSEEGDGTEKVATEALSEASSHATASEGGSSAIASQITAQMDVMEEELRFAKDISATMNPQGYISPDDQVHQLAGACKYSSRSCSAGTGTVNWDSCSISGANTSITMTGGWTETWSDVGDCTLGYLSGIGNTVKRSSTGSVINFAGGATISTDTAGGTAWDGTVFSAGKVITTRGSTTNRSIAMDPVNTSAIHKVFKGRRGSTLFDYYTVPALTVSGSKSNGTTNGLGSSSANRALTGTVTIYHNLAKYNATNTFTAVTWADATCCYPTSGTISTTFTGTGAPSSMLTTFTSSCGQATLAVTGGSTTTITLTSCQ